MVTVPVNEVNVVFTVTDKHNHYVKDLKEGDFKILDDKKPPASIRNRSARRSRQSARAGARPRRSRDHCRREALQR